jgi:type II secretory pathway pseudopilin PulG
MKKMKCAQCGLVNWDAAEACKRCGAHFQLGNDTLFAQAAYAASQSTPYQTAPAAAPYQSAPSAAPYQSVPSAISYQSAPAAVPYQSAPYPYPYYPQMQQSTGLAIASLIVGIISIFTLGLLGIGALTGMVLAIVALVKIKNNPARYGGQGMAIAGLVTSAVSLVLAFFIVMAIAIPNLLAARRAANEGSTLSQMRTIGSMERVYQATNGNGEFGTLEELRSNGSMDSKLANGTYNGYRFTVRVKHATRDTPASYEAVATPLSYGDTGIRSFYIDETGVIRFADKRGAEANAKDPLLGN